MFSLYYSPVAALRAAVIFACVSANSSFAAPVSGYSASSARSDLADAWLITALQNNPNLAAMQAALTAAKQRIAPAGALEDPQVFAALAPATINGFTDAQGRERNPNIRFEITQQLPWPGKRDLREDIARQQSLAVSEQLTDLRLTMAAAIRAEYANWVYVHRALAINKKSRRLLAELQRVAEQRYASGTNHQQDVLQAEIEQLRLEHQKIELKRLRDTVRVRANTLMSLPVNQTLGEPGGFPLQKQPSHSLTAIDSLYDSAIKNHPVLQTLQRNLEVGSMQQALAEKDFYPDFKVYAGYNSLWDANDKRWVLGAGINVPLNQGKYRARVDEAKADNIRLQLQLDERRNQLLSDIEQTRFALAESHHEITLYTERLLPKIKESIRLAQSAYQSGSGNFLNIIAAEQQRLDAELSLEKSRAEYYTNYAQLERWLVVALPNSEINIEVSQ